MIQRFLSNKTFITIGGLVFLTGITLVNVWVVKKTAQPQTGAQVSITRLYFTPSNLTLGSNQSFTANLILDPGDNQVSALDATITFDSFLLELVSLTPNQSVADFPVVKTEAGKIVLAAVPKDFEQSPNFTAGSLATLTFKPKVSNLTTEIKIEPSSIAAFAGQNLLTLDSDSKLKVRIK